MLGFGEVFSNHKKFAADLLQSKHLFTSLKLQMNQSDMHQTSQKPQQHVNFVSIVCFSLDTLNLGYQPTHKEDHC